MTIKEANEIIENDAASFNNWVMAAATLTSSSESSLIDLVRCLKRRGLPAEMAATALYVRTKRPRTDESIETIILDPEDWGEYLKGISQ